MIVELQPDVPAPARRALVVATLAVLAVAASLAPDLPSGPLGVLRLAPEEADVQLAAIPEWIVNDPQPRHTVVTRVRRTMGLAVENEGQATLSWSEGPFFYRLSSATLSVAELARVAGRLR